MSKTPETIQFNISDNNEGTRLDLVLSAGLEDYSRSFIQKLFEGGLIQVNGEECREKKRKCKVGDVVTIQVPPPSKLEVTPENIPLDIVYEDEDVLVVKDDPSEFADAVVTLYQNETELLRLSEKTQEYIKAHFSVDAAWSVIEKDFTR